MIKQEFRVFLVLLVLVSVTSGCSGQNRNTTSQQATGSLQTAAEVEGKSYIVSSDFNGFNAQMLRGPSWKTPGFVERVKELYPGIIRYPGGTVASYWDWKSGWLMEGIELRSEWKSITQKNPITIEDLKYACDQTGASPVFVVNMMTSTLSYQLEMLRYAQKTGLPVKYVELDNELYLGEAFYVKKYTTGVEYANDANIWIAAIKKEFPGVRIAAVGSSVKEGAAKKEKKHAERTNNWNRDVISILKGCDALTFHIYGGSGLNYIVNQNSAPDDDETPSGKNEALQKAFDKSGSVPFILGSPFLRWNNANMYDYKILPQGMKAWVTEYNLFEREGIMAGTWVHGLYALSQTLLFMENPATELICFHNLTTSAQFAAIFNNDQGFAKAYKKKPNKPFDFTAAGYCLSMSGKAMSEGGKAVKLKFSDNVMQSAARGQKYPSLNGWVIQSGKGKKIIVTNLSDTETTVDFSKTITGNVQYEQLNSDPLKQIASENDVVKSKGTGTKIKLPAYSVTLIEGE
ncbi:MAG TPA: hypothetical protein PKD91_00450 [Bacteroidia bacterium]|nr:hypothetical protein [Bacteroidia bacterium]